MEKAERDSGIDLIGKVPWGTHFCLCYKTGDDLSDILVSFFDAGVRNNEFCMCVTADPVNVNEMKGLMRAAMPDFDNLVSKGQIEIIPYSQWYLIDGVFDQTRVLEGWNDKLRQAQKKGYDGARVTGNTFWLDKPIWKDFLEYEQAIDGAIEGRNFIVLCTYSLDRCTANEIIDVVSAHQFALTKCDSEWKVIENSKLKETRKALRESEKKYHDLVENANSIIIRWDIDGNLTFFNEFAQKFFGYRESEILGKNVMDTIVPLTETTGRDLTAMIEDIKRSPERYIANVNENIRRNGERVWISWTNRPILDTQGNVVEILSVGNDITERRSVEEALQDSEARYRSLFDNMLNGFAHCKMLFDNHDNPIDFVYLNVNTAFGKLTGLENVVGRKVTDAIPGIKEAHPELFKIYGRVALTGQPETFEIEFKPFVAWLSISVYSTERGYFTAIFEDITERKQAEEAIIRSEQMLQLVMDNIPQAIFWKDRNSAYLGCNKIFAKAAGLGMPSDILGKTDYDLPWSGEQADIFREYDHKVMENDMPEYNIVEQIREAGGRIAWIETNKVPLHDVKGNVAGILGTYGDITERKQAEEALKDAKAQAELYLDLMGHDINNMHQIALGYLELARDRQADSEHTRFLDTPMEVLQRSARLVQNVRKLQKLKEGVFQTQVVDVREVLEDVQREFGAVPDKTVTLNVNGCEQCQVLANEILYDVFANLVSNAIKHTVDRTDIIVDLDVVKDNGGRYCRVMVEDNGPGISDDFKARIFNRMLKGTAKSKGMGLGLYLVKSLVESYHGKVWIEDRVIGDHTKGARFVVMLPAVE